jgi:hypothetical protein
VYKLKDKQQQFELIEEIEWTLQGNKYHDRREEVDTNPVICSPTIDQHMKQNIMEKRSQKEKSVTKMDMYEIEISDDTQE